MPGNTCHRWEKGRKTFHSLFFLPSESPHSLQGLPLAGPSFKAVDDRAGNGVCRSRVRDGSEDILTLHGKPDFWVVGWNWVKVQSIDFWGEGLSLHDIIQNLIISSFSFWLPVTLIFYFYPTGKFCLSFFYHSIIVKCFENSPWMILLVNFQMLTYIKCQGWFDLL